MNVVTAGLIGSSEPEFSISGFVYMYAGRVSSYFFQTQ